MTMNELRPTPALPRDQWWVAGFSWELKDKPVARTLLNVPVVLFRTPEGQVGALEDRCCHKDLPLSMGSIETAGLRCGYHGMLFDCRGACIEIPGQEKIPSKARVRSFTVREQDQILWIWFGSSPESQPTVEPPRYEIHSDPRFKFGGGVVHYDAPYQLIHDNLLDLSHVGYVHIYTIGGNAGTHMNAKLTVEQSGDIVRVVRHMPDSEPPPTYTAAWPFEGRIDRWQEVEFRVSHVRIWTGAVEHGAAALDNPQRDGFHMRGFHGITPETDTTAHYFWTIATNPHPDKQDVTQLVVDQTQKTFLEDKVVIEAQWKNQKRFGHPAQVDIHVDVGPNRARRVIQRLAQV